MATLPIGPHRLEEMLRYCIDLSKRMLEANGAFYPFGAIIDASGNLRPVTADTGKESPKTPDVYHAIREGMRAQFHSSEIVAGCIVAQVITPAEFKSPYEDSIRLAVESSSISRIVFVPFRARKVEPAEPETPNAHTCEVGEYLGVDVRPHLFVDAEPPAGAP